jgi:mRNA interferase RelE/StbE
VNYRIDLVRSTERELHALPITIHKRVVARLLRLSEEPRPRGSRKLSQGPGWRLRIGDYRVLYTVDDTEHVITVYSIGHRRDVYRH